MMQNTNPNASSGLSPEVAALLGTKEGVVKVAKPKLDLTTTIGSKIDPHALISPEDDDALKGLAQQMVAEQKLSIRSFLEIAKPFNVSQVDVLDAVLETMRANDSGQFGDLVLDTNKTVRRMKKKLPKSNSRLAEKIAKGKAKAEEIINFVRELSDEIKKALDVFDDMLEAMREHEALMEEHYNSAFELVLRSIDLRDEQDGRTDKLIKLLALIDYFRMAVAARMAELQQIDSPAVKDEIEVLVAVGPMITRRLANIAPMILKGNLNEVRFMTQAQINAMNALDLRDYIDVYISQIKTDIVLGLLALESQANMFVVRTGIDLAEKASAEANEEFQKQVDQSIDLISKTMVDLDALTKLLDDTIDSGQKLRDAYSDAAETGNDALRKVEAGRKDLEQAEENAAEEIRQILEK